MKKLTDNPQVQPGFFFRWGHQPGGSLGHPLVQQAIHSLFYPVQCITFDRLLIECSQYLHGICDVAPAKESSAGLGGLVQQYGGLASLAGLNLNGGSRALKLS